MPEQDDTQQSGIYINGDRYTEDDLTYREQRQMRELIRELAANGDKAFDPGDAALIDIVPAFVCVVQRRTNPDFSLEDALDMKPTDLQAPEPVVKGGRRRPTKAAA